MTSKKLILFCIALLQVFTSFAEKNLWTLHQEKDITVPGERRILPNEYVLAQLNTTEFKLFQSLIPLEETGLYANISLPTPTGEMMEFRVFECPMMEKELALKYPMIKTYTALAVDHPGVTAKLDFTTFGFHALVFNGEETYFIDPLTKIPSDYYQVYFKKDYSKPKVDRMHCEVDDNPNPFQAGDAVALDTELPKNAFKQNGTLKRSYRLALACTYEYAQFHCSPNPITKPVVLSAMTTTMNRVNGVFELDFSMHCNLIANNDTLIFTTSTDPYSNNSGSSMLSQNQTTVNTRIGSANYDIGHVFSTGGGGIASLASVCGSNKAQGVTGSNSPEGDPFDIDYVAHEMGHQYGGNHSFNSVSGSCQGNRSINSAFEIGSGTTIMSYAGICDNDNIQQHSDAYYHTKSLEEMTNSAVTACATTENSNNSLPTMPSIKTTYIVPYRTSYELVAPQAVDADNDPLYYCWEEFDKGGNSGNAWNAAATSTTFAMQRSFIPTKNRVRYIPAWKELLKNTESYLGERLPENARLFRYRCTVRDIHNGYGAFYTSDSLTVDSRTTTGLFRVTSQGTTGLSYNAWQSIPVSWDVAGTTAAPFSTSTVDIMMSVDSGKTWWTVVPNTPNDGSESFICPSIGTNFARIKVKAVGNIYFDLNDNFFKVVAAPNSVKDFMESDIQIFPNPVNDILHVEMNKDLVIESLQIMDMSGRIIAESSPKQHKADVSTVSLSSGMYQLRLVTPHGIRSTKFIK